MASVVNKITNFSSPLFYASVGILGDSISDRVQLPKQRLHNLLASGTYECFVLCDGEEPQAVALVYFSPERRFAWLDYMAVRMDLRGRGLGTALAREIVQDARVRSGIGWLLLEVDDDREGEDEVKRRRIEFYRRLGFRLLANVPYRFPSAFSSPVPMRLLACGLNAKIEELSADDIKAAVSEIFANIHGRSRHDELLMWFERNLPDRVELE